MVPALKSFTTTVFVLLFFASQLSFGFAQSSSRSRLTVVSDTAGYSDPALDDEARELLAEGKPGVLIESVRSEVLVLLSESGSCTDWFLSAEPSSLQKFRSLRFVLDRAGEAEIVKLDGAGAVSGYFHPYVAATRQNVGPGSTVTVNANGAFFRASALVRDTAHPAERISASAYRALNVGNYAGGSPEAQLLTVLHEFGHIVDLLPVDAEVPSAPFISIRNTETVLHHCRSQIQLHAKHLHKLQTFPHAPPITAVYASNASFQKPQPFAQKRAFHGEPSYRYDGW